MMPSFPRRFPAPLGGGEDRALQFHRAILQELSDVFDVSEGTVLYHETYAEACWLSMLWAANERLGSQMNPLRMIDVLADWEEASGLRPNDGDSDYDRRRSLAAKMRLLSGNNLNDLVDAAQKALGQNFETVLFPAVDQEIIYIPGVNPGHPGYEYSSNVSTMAVRMNENSLLMTTAAAKLGTLASIFDTLLPSWMSYAVGVGDGFILGISILGKTLL
jgi:hypothetical protein